MLDTREIHPLTDFLRNHKAHVTRLKETHAPEVLTVNGKAEIVIQDAESYQRMIDRLHHMETVAAIQEGMASAERPSGTDIRRSSAGRPQAYPWPERIASGPCPGLRVGRRNRAAGCRAGRRSAGSCRCSRRRRSC